MTEPLIHIGFHKTGSSWLQKWILRNPEAGYWAPWSREELRGHFVISNPFAYDAKHVRAHFTPMWQDAERRGQIPCLTDEMLSGNPWKGSWPSVDTMERLYKAFPEAKVLIVIREQVSMISSLWRHYVRAGGTASLERYLLQPKTKSGWEPLFQLGYLEYHYLIRHYMNLFGEDKVLVLPFEWLCEYPRAFVEQVNQFSGAVCGIDVPESSENRGLTAMSCELKRYLNMISSADRATGTISWRWKAKNKLVYSIDRLVPDKTRAKSNKALKERIKSLIGDHYVLSNRDTSRLIGINLDEAGYKCRSSDNGSDLPATML